jgi:hypothetical protein
VVNKGEISFKIFDRVPSFHCSPPSRKGVKDGFIVLIIGIEIDIDIDIDLGIESQTKVIARGYSNRNEMVTAALITHLAIGYKTR